VTDNVVRVERVIPADAQRLFDVLADPAMHPLIDGSGTVRQPRPDAPTRLSPGAHFTIQMRSAGVPYRMRNEVVEFIEGRRIAWRHPGHHVWRYILEPVDGGTRVTEEYDWGASRAPWALSLLRYPQRTGPAMERTLARLQDQVTTAS
jgi:uncharacterized protein YndB with AHSA1/START domain